MTEVNKENSQTQLKSFQQKLQLELDNSALAQVRHIAMFAGLARVLHSSSTIESDQGVVSGLTNAAAYALVNMTQEQDRQRPEFANKLTLEGLYVVSVKDFVEDWCEAYKGQDSRRIRAVECALSLSRCALLQQSERNWAADCANALLFG
jgi:hypothetical protein